MITEEMEKTLAAYGQAGEESITEAWDLAQNQVGYQSVINHISHVSYRPAAYTKKEPVSCILCLVRLF